MVFGCALHTLKYPWDLLVYLVIICNQLLKCQQINPIGHTGTIWVMTYSSWEFSCVLNLSAQRILHHRLYCECVSGHCCLLEYGRLHFIWIEVNIPLCNWSGCWDLIKLSVFFKSSGLCLSVRSLDCASRYATVCFHLWGIHAASTTPGVYINFSMFLSPSKSKFVVLK